LTLLLVVFTANYVDQLRVFFKEEVKIFLQRGGLFPVDEKMHR